MASGKLFEEYRLGGKVAKNRFLRSATNDHLSDPDGMLTEEQQEAFLCEMDALSEQVNTSDLQPVILLDSDKPKDFSAVSISQYGEALQAETRDSFSELLDEYYLRRDKAESMRRKSQTLTKTVKTLRDRTAKKLALRIVSGGYFHF